MSLSVFEAWKAALVRLAETLGRTCPRCGKRRRLKWRKPMRIEVLGLSLHRTKDRYCVAGAWHEDNLESKATLRAIIFDGRWEAFCDELIDRSMTQFKHDLRARLQLAVQQGRICDDKLTDFAPEKAP